MIDTCNSKEAGQARYDAYWARQLADPEFVAIYEEEAKKGLWLQLVEARLSATSPGRSLRRSNLFCARSGWRIPPILS